MKTIFTFAFFALILSANAQSLALQVQDRTFEQGDTVQFVCEVYDFVNIGSFQFALKCDTGDVSFSHIEFTGNLPGLDNNDFSWFGKPGYGLLVPGEIRSVWSDPYGKTVADGLIIFKINFVAKTSGTLSEAVQVWENHPVLKPRAYRAIPLASIGLDIAYYLPATSSTAEQTAQPMRVWPNPFLDSFNVEGLEGVDRLRLYNAKGAMLWEINTECSTLARFEVDSNFAPGFYVLEGASAGERRTVKLIKR